MYGRGFGRGRGMGFGFRGSSPPWPYVGIGRGGLPRCGYFFSGAAGTPVAWPYQQAPYEASPGFSVGQGSYPPYAGAPSTPGYAPFAPQMSPDQKIDFLNQEAEAIKEQLEQIETRINNLENAE